MFSYCKISVILTLISRELSNILSEIMWNHKKIIYREVCRVFASMDKYLWRINCLKIRENKSNICFYISIRLKKYQIDFMSTFITDTILEIFENLSLYLLFFKLLLKILIFLEIKQKELIKIYVKWLKSVNMLVMAPNVIHKVI